MSPDNPVALQLEDISFSYGEAPVLHGISLAVNRGEYLSLVGPNGSGKSTLLQLMCGYLQPLAGRALSGGQEIQRIDSRTRAKTFAVIHQNEDNRFPFTCLETVLMGLHPHRARFEPINEDSLLQAERIMNLTNTWLFAEKPVSCLSGGELQRVMLARALMQRPQVLFLDEAMSGMDISVRIAMHSLLRSLIAEEGLTVVAINHDLHAAYRFSDRIAALSMGRLASLGTPPQVMNPSFFRSVFGVEADVFEGQGFIIRDRIADQSMEKERFL
jgi:iron complex transport system ATP-binding protein